MRILFLGTDSSLISTACLKKLLENEEGVIAAGIHDPLEEGLFRAARRAFRSRGGATFLSSCLYHFLLRIEKRVRGTAGKKGRSPRLPSLREQCRAKGIPCIASSDFNDRRVVERVAALGPDLVAVASFPQILKGPLLALPRLGCVNMHPSLLPAYRGPEPWYWIRERSERVTGVTAHFVTKEVDCGDIILQEEFPVPGENEPAGLIEVSALKGADLLARAVRLVEEGRAPRIPQDPSRASYFPKPPRRWPFSGKDAP